MFADELEMYLKSKLTGITLLLFHQALTKVFHEYYTSLPSNTLVEKLFSNE